MYGKTRMAPTPNPDAYYSVNASPVNDQPARYVGPYPPAPSFHPSSNRYNTMNESSLNAGSSGVTSPYTPMGSLNIPAANGIYGPPSGRVSAGLSVNLPLPLPMSMQSHGINGTHFTSFNPSEGPSPIMEAATAQFSGPSMDTVRSLETEGHLV